MIIAIDGNEANVKTRVGVGEYAFQILTQLSKLKTPHQFVIYLKNTPLPDLPKSTPNWQYQIFGPKKLWTKIALPFHLFLSSPKPNIFYTPGHYTPPFSPCPLVPTIHDLGYLNSPEQFTKKDFHQLKNWTAQSIKNAHHLFTVSEFSKKEIEKIYQIPSTKITVTPNGVGDLPKKIIPPLVKPPYFLSVGTLKPNKNIPFLITAFAKFFQKHPNYKLVIAGQKGWLFDEIFTKVKKLNLPKQVIFTGFVSETQKWSLYHHASALIIPSLYEGFGRPAIEAMKTGCPVIASSIPPLKEVIENAGLFINPQNKKTLISAMEKIIKPDVSQKYSRLGPPQASKYTWTKSATTILNTLNQL
ncbi:glycosyltransferase family 4 protein [Patescibacteria group bacterium]|nr:glycosyltransferase family 4 protein [Patescibacteria group bacterium]